MMASFAGEHEEMTMLLAAQTREYNELKDKYVVLDMKFKQYYAKSDNHIKTQAIELERLKQELQTMQYRH